MCVTDKVTELDAVSDTVREEVRVPEPAPASDSVVVGLAGAVGVVLADSGDGRVPLTETLRLALLEAEGEAEGVVEADSDTVGEPDTDVVAVAVLEELGVREEVSEGVGEALDVAVLDVEGLSDAAPDAVALSDGDILPLNERG